MDSVVTVTNSLGSPVSLLLVAATRILKAVSGEQPLGGLFNHTGVDLGRHGRRIYGR